MPPSAPPLERSITASTPGTSTQDEHLDVPSIMDAINSLNSVQDEHYITVLQSRGRPQTKSFHMEGGQLKVVSYSLAATFDAKRHVVKDLESLYRLLQQVVTTPTQCLVRGVPHNDLMGVRRTNENFPEPSTGCHWAMLDIDGMELPEGMSPLGRDALELFISKLPGTFHHCSYVYQFSSSAGVLNPDNTLRKQGLCAHIFLWFRNPVPTKLLATHLKLHCLNTGFYSITSFPFVVRYGVDMAMLNAPSQPHYVATPMIGPGVTCLLSPEQRMGFVRKQTDSVTLPELEPSLIREVKQREQQIKHKEAKRLGLRTRIQQTRTERGISQHRYYAPSEEQRQTMQLGRRFIDAKTSDEHRTAILFFEGENSPGSWWVHQDRPTMAVRFGDYAKIPLQELSSEAYAHVRDELRWFKELPHRPLKLLESGHLPPFSSFMSTKISLLLAPTGTGKTHRYIEFASQEERKDLLKIYAAPRIVLVQQMAEDLRKRHQPFHVYDQLQANEQFQHGHVLTTTQSLPRILNRAYELGRPFVLVLDEIHVSLDDAMRSEKSLQSFENGMVRAEQVIMMTGTLTDLQLRTVSQVICHALPTLRPTDYGCYEFEPIKSHPLEIRHADAFPEDLLELLLQYNDLIKQGSNLPRTVLILDTSRMERFRILLEEHSLTDFAEVVSRKENTDDEIDEAVISTKPILITTSLFAVGLNLPFPPERLWCCFDMISADTNQIVQAINRANRTNTPCEVRIYARAIDQTEVFLPGNMPDQVRNALEDEASVSGYLEEYFHIDRLTYRMLRDHEKDTPTALGTLIRLDAFQNYKLIQPDEGSRGSSKAARKTYAEAGREARTRYDQSIVSAAQNLSGFDEKREYFDRLDDLRLELSERQRHEEPRTDQEIENDRRGALSRLCDLGPEALPVIRLVSEIKVAVLFGERFPWHSEQYNPEVCADHGKVKAEKLEAILAVLEFVEALRQGNSTESQLINAMTRGEALQRGFLALEWGEKPYQKLHKRFEQMKKDMAAVRKRSARYRQLAGRAVLDLLHDLLREIGVYFMVAKGEDGRKKTDFTRPVVPAGWQLEAMRKNLQAHVERFRALPTGSGTLSLRQEDQLQGHEPRALSLCQNCVFLWRGCCTRGYPLHGIMGDYWAGETSCEGYHEASSRQSTVIATRMPYLVATAI